MPIQYFSALASTELCLYDSELSLESKNSSIIVSAISLYALHALVALLFTNTMRIVSGCGYIRLIGHNLINTKRRCSAVTHKHKAKKIKRYGINTL